MSKAHRGKGIRDQFAHGRGECPVCKKSNIKVLYEQEAEGQKFKVCKICKASIKNGKKKLPVVSVVKEEPVPEAPKVEAKTEVKEESVKTESAVEATTE
jgi:hypothetical protein